jgi:hypothetical protein
VPGLAERLAHDPGSKIWEGDLPSAPSVGTDSHAGLRPARGDLLRDLVEGGPRLATGRHGHDPQRSNRAGACHP